MAMRPLFTSPTIQQSPQSAQAMPSGSSLAAALAGRSPQMPTTPSPYGGLAAGLGDISKLMMADYVKKQDLSQQWPPKDANPLGGAGSDPQALLAAPASSTINAQWSQSTPGPMSAVSDWVQRQMPQAPGTFRVDNPNGMPELPGQGGGASLPPMPGPSGAAPVQGAMGTQTTGGSGQAPVTTFLDPQSQGGMQGAPGQGGGAMDQIMQWLQNSRKDGNPPGVPGTVGGTYGMPLQPPTGPGY